MTQISLKEIQKTENFKCCLNYNYKLGDSLESVHQSSEQMKAWKLKRAVNSLFLQLTLNIYIIVNSIGRPPNAGALLIPQWTF